MAASTSGSHPTTLLDAPPFIARTILERWAAEHGLPAYRARQIHRRLWQAPIKSWADATELPVVLRAELERDFPLPSLTADTIQQSIDGTRKYLWRLFDG